MMRTNAHTAEKMERKETEMKQHDQYQLFQVIEMDAPSRETDANFVNEPYGITDEAMAMDYRGALELIFDGWDSQSVAVGDDNLASDLTNEIDETNLLLDYLSEQLSDSLQANQQSLFSGEEYDGNGDNSIEIATISDEFTDQIAELFKSGQVAYESRSQLAAAVQALESALLVNDDLS